MSGDSCPPNDKVVLVPGLWFGRPALWLLAWRLRRHGLRAILYRYDARSAALPAAREALARLMAVSGAHYVVGYSLGGIVVADFCRYHPRAYERAVVLGAPFRGSRAARRLYRCPAVRGLFGVAAPVLVHGLRLGAIPRLGVVTGLKPYGLARCLLAGRAHDGVLRACETRLRGARDAVALPLSHAGLVMSRVSARVIGTYLACGRFGD